MSNVPAPMHPRYTEFLAFMAECPHRKTPSTLETAFWVWLKCNHRTNQDIQDLAVFGGQQAETIQSLKRDLDRKHRECAERERQVLVQAEEIERLNDELMQLKRNIAIALDYGAVTERGDACLAIDGGNL